MVQSCPVPNSSIVWWKFLLGTTPSLKDGFFRNASMTRLIAPSSTCSAQFHMFRSCPFQRPELKSPKVSLSLIQNIQTNKKAGMLNNTWESVTIGFRGVYFHAYSEFMFTFLGNIYIYMYIYMIRCFASSDLPTTHTLAGLEDVQHFNGVRT